MDGDLSFERDLKPLFRESDRTTMLSVAKFDLWERDDVADNSQAILERLENGSMPCDQAWPADHVEAFRRWIEAGMPAQPAHLGPWDSTRLRRLRVYTGTL